MNADASSENTEGMPNSCGPPSPNPSARSGPLSPNLQQNATSPEVKMRSSHVASLEWLLHCGAAIILLTFAFSHFAGFTVAHPSQFSLNTVFPFLTNRSMYIAAGILELTTAAICVIKRGTDAANVAIFVFIFIIIWYRWSLHYTGGDGHCHCVGIMALALKLSKTEEKVIPIVALILLGSTIFPWFINGIVCMTQSLRRMRKSLLFIMLAGVFALRQSAYSQQTIEVTGRYDTEMCNPRIGGTNTNWSGHFLFNYKCAGKAWSIYVTNAGSTVEVRNDWEGMVYDGTNSYTFMPNDKAGNSKVHQQRATVSPGPVFLRDYDEWLDFDVIWLTYGFCPLMIPTNKGALIELALPWHNCRTSPLAHGYEWKITPSMDGKFISQCLVVRNTNLDLDLDGELLRPDINVAPFLGNRSGFNEGLLSRRGKSSGHVEATYKCLDWIRTNGTALPRIAEEVRYASALYSNPTFRAQVNAFDVSVREGCEPIIPNVADETIVADYRFRKANAKAAFPCVTYVLSRGSAWKPANDPALLRQAEQGFAFVVDQSNYGLSKRRSYLTWVVLACALLPIAIFFNSRKSEQTLKKQST